MDDWQQRTGLLLGEDKCRILAEAHVLIVGMGGVGGYAAEMLCRAGVGALTVADADVFSLTNINRQLGALHSTVGTSKNDVFERRFKDINPSLVFTSINKYIRDDVTWELLDSAKFDYVVDCIDTLSPKANLIKGALDRGIKVVSSMGSGAKTVPELVEIKDIAKTHHCPLAHMLRKRLHKMGINSGFNAVFSPEAVREGAMVLCDEQNKKSNVGTISYIPAVFGCFCASVVIRDLLDELNV